VTQRTSRKYFFPWKYWLPLVNKSTLKSDVIAGLTGAVFVLPQGIALALIAGLPAEYGLYAAMVVPVVLALFGSSYHMISGPATPVSVVVFAVISTMAIPGEPHFIKLALLLTFMVGVFQLVMGLVKFGNVVNFVSHTVIIAFTAGAAILIGGSQLKHFLGIDFHGTGSFVKKMWGLGGLIGDTNEVALLIGGFTLVIGFLIKTYLKKWPYMLIAMVAGSLLCYGINGAEKGIKFVGEIPGGIPIFQMPNFEIDNMRALAGKAIALALLGLIEAIAIARSIAIKSGQRIDANQEFVGQGLSNIVTSFFSGYASSGSFSRSAVNTEAGAKTPMAMIFASAWLLVLVLFLAGFTKYLPMPAMAGIILIVAYNLIDAKQIRAILKSSPTESIVMATTIIGILVFKNMELALYIGIILSLFFYLRKTSQPHMAVMAPDPEDEQRRFIFIIRKAGIEECPQIKMIRIDGALFYGAIDHIDAYFNSLREGEEKHCLIIANGINFVDLSGAEWLAHEAEKWKQKGGGLYVVGLKRIAQPILNKGGFKEEIGVDRFFNVKKDAIDYIYKQVDYGACETCDKRIFLECDKGNAIVSALAKEEAKS